MKKYLFVLLAVVCLLISWATPALAASDADVTVTYTVEYLAITDNVTTIDFSTIATSSTPSTNTSQVGITNDSSVQVDAYIGVTAATWTGGVAHTHADDATPGPDTVGMKANRGGTWGAGDVIVKYGGGTYATWNFIYENCGIGVDFDYGLKLWAPTTTSDGVQKQNTVRITVVSG